MNRLDGGGVSDEIKENRNNINNRLEEMRRSVIPSFWYSFFKSSWLIAIVIALILLFTSGDGKGIFAGGEMPPARIAAIVLIVYGILADLVIAPLVKSNFLKKHPQYKNGCNVKAKSQKKATAQSVYAYSTPKKTNKKMSKTQKARLGTSAEEKGDR